MIISVWKPRITKINKKSVITHYEKDSLDFLIVSKKQGWIITYKCDICKSDLIHSTHSHVLFNIKNKFNTLNHQTCRSCRSKISEYEIKKNFIPFEEIKKSIVNAGYKLNNTEKQYSESQKKSQMKLDVVCNSGHELKTTWNNWRKGKRCRTCYINNKLENAVKTKNGWERYKFLVWVYSEKSYKKYFDYINPNNLSRGKENHLDHKYSICEGFINNISPKIIGNKENLEVIPAEKNLSKHKKCSITLEELKEKTKYL